MSDQAGGVRGVWSQGLDVGQRRPLGGLRDVQGQGASEVVAAAGWGQAGGGASRPRSFESGA